MGQRPIVVTGGASGIGQAIARALCESGRGVITVDLHDADVIADLSQPSGRRRAFEGVRNRASAIGGVVAAAGVTSPGRMAVAVNYFGVVDLLDDLRTTLDLGTPPAAVVVASVAAVLPIVDDTLVEACLAHDEPLALDRASGMKHHVAYASSKQALIRWVALTAPTPSWMGSGIRLNAVAPGIVDTPLVRSSLDDPGARLRLHDAVPMPIGEVATPEDVAGPVLFLLSSAARFICGQTLFVDGGAKAVLRPDLP